MPDLQTMPVFLSLGQGFYWLHESLPAAHTSNHISIPQGPGKAGGACILQPRQSPIFRSGEKPMNELIEYKAMLKDPARYFKEPQDVVIADSLDAAQKIDILKAWEARAYTDTEDRNMRGKLVNALSRVLPLD